MLIADIHRYFKILVNKLDSANYQNLEPEEIDILLNQGMFKLIEQRAYGSNPKKQSVEETQKRVDDLRNITQTYSVTPSATHASNKTNGKFVILPSDYRHALHEECLIAYTDCNSVARTKRVPVIPVTHDRYNKIIEDPFNEPFEDLVIRLAHGEISGNEVFELITDGTYTISTYYLRYLQTPASMQFGSTYASVTTDVECPLSEHLHRELVELVAQGTLETIESPRIRTYPSIVKDTE